MTSNSCDEHAKCNMVRRKTLKEKIRELFKPKW